MSNKTDEEIAREAWRQFVEFVEVNIKNFSLRHIPFIENAFYAHCLAAIREAKQQPAWIRTSERAPTVKDGDEDGDVYTCDPKTKCLGIVHWKEAKKKTNNWPYWMPIPPLPSEQQPATEQEIKMASVTTVSTQHEQAGLHLQTVNVPAAVPATDSPQPSIGIRIAEKFDDWCFSAGSRYQTSLHREEIEKLAQLIDDELRGEPMRVNKKAGEATCSCPDVANVGHEPGCARLKQMGDARRMAEAAWQDVKERIISFDSFAQALIPHFENALRAQGSRVQIVAAIIAFCLCGCADPIGRRSPFDEHLMKCAKFEEPYTKHNAEVLADLNK